MIPPPAMSLKKVVRHAGLVSFATLLSRVLGYARDALLASAFGGGHLTDAFYAAFRIPNLLRRILGEGPLTSAFVPLFTQHLEKGERLEAKRFFQTLFSTLAVLLTVLVGLGILFAPQITHLIAWGFHADPAKFDLTVRLSRVMFPFLLFVCLAAIASGALNSLGHFFLPALAPAMLSVAEIGFVVFLIKRWSRPMDGLAWSALAGGVLHFAVLLPLLSRENILPRWRWEPQHPEIRRVGLALLPAVWGLSADQINAFFDTLCASFLVEGSVTALYNSNRLVQFPLALFGIAVSTAALPSLSAAAARGNWGEMKGTLNLSLRIVLFSILPAMGGLLILGRPVVELLFEHGQFTPRATLLTVSALNAFALGLPAFAAVKVLVSAFYSLKDTGTPVRVATLCILVNMAGNVAFMGRWGVGGLAFATTLASLVNAGVLLVLLRRRLGLLGGRRLAKTFLQSLVACGAMTAAVFAVLTLLPGGRLAQVPLAVLAGALAYLGTARAMRMEELSHVGGFFRK